MQNFSQSEQNVTNFQNSWGEVYFHVIAIFTNLQKVLTTWKFSCRNNIAGNIRMLD